MNARLGGHLRRGTLASIRSGPACAIMVLKRVSHSGSSRIQTARLRGLSPSAIVREVFGGEPLGARRAGELARTLDRRFLRRGLGAGLPGRTKAKRALSPALPVTNRRQHSPDIDHDRSGARDPRPHVTSAAQRPLAVKGDGAVTDLE
jgi:hypothetical protein